MCPLWVGSFSYSTNETSYNWMEKRRQPTWKPIQIDNRVKLSQFDILSTSWNSTKYIVNSKRFIWTKEHLIVSRLMTLWHFKIILSINSSVFILSLSDTLAFMSCKFTYRLRCWLSSLGSHSIWSVKRLPIDHL